MLTLQQLCSNAIGLFLPFSVSHVPRSTTDTVQTLYSTLKANGIALLDVIPSYIVVKGLHCTHEQRVRLFRHLGNTTCLDLEKYECSNLNLKSLLSTLQIMCNDLTGNQRALKILRLPKMMDFTIRTLEEICLLCPNLEILGVSGPLKTPEQYSLVRDFANKNTRLRVEVRSLFNPEVMLPEPRDSNISKTIRIHPPKQTVEEVIALQRLYIENRYIPLEFGLQINNREELEKFKMLFAGPSGSSNERFERFVWEECLIYKLVLRVADLRQDELDYLMTFRIAHLSLFYSNVVRIYSTHLDQFDCYNCSHLESVVLPYTEGLIKAYYCPNLTELDVPRTCRLDVMMLDQMNRIEAQSAGSGRVRNCSRVKEICFPVAHEKIQIFECPLLQSIFAPSVKVVTVEKLPKLLMLNFSHAETVTVSHCNAIVKAVLPKLKKVDFLGCASLEHLDAQAAVSSELHWAFDNLRNLKFLNIPSFTGKVHVNALHKLETLNAENAERLILSKTVNRRLQYRGPRGSIFRIEVLLMTAYFVCCVWSCFRLALDFYENESKTLAGFVAVLFAETVLPGCAYIPYWMTIRPIITKIDYEERLY